MGKEQTRIIYMGTPDFAVEPLKALREAGYNVIAVVTTPDKPAGRGYKLQSSPVKRYAVEQGLPVLQPEKLKDEAFLQELKTLNADLQVVVAFRMLPKVVWNMPKMGTFNLHASLLPQYRGAAPINHAIINGEEKTGVTTFFLDENIDTGDIIDRIEVSILADDDAGTLHDKLMKEGAALVVKTVQNIIEGKVKTLPQSAQGGEEVLHPAPKIYKDFCRIDWQRPRVEVQNFVRGLSPYPVAWTTLRCADGRELPMKIFRVSAVAHKGSYAPGALLVKDGQLLVAAGDGLLSIESLQLSGKKRLEAEAFLRGFRFDEQDRLG